MALFGKKKESAATTDTAKKEKRTGVPAASKKGETKGHGGDVGGRDVSSIIIQPRVTEKAAIVGEKNVYTFEVRRNASKYDIRDAIKALFKVTPVKIRIVNRKPRTFVSRMRGRRGTHPGMKKAYVYLKEGDKIDLV